MTPQPHLCIAKRDPSFMAQGGLSASSMKLCVFKDLHTIVVAAGHQADWCGDEPLGWASEGSSSSSVPWGVGGDTYWLYDLEQITKLQILSFSV